MPAHPAFPSALSADGEGSLAFALWCVPGMGRARTARLRERFGSLREALGRPASELAAAGLPPEVAAAVAGGGALGRGEAAIRSCERLGAFVLLPGEPGWPDAFERVQSPPGAVFCLGARPRHPAAALVGSRAADAYGLEFARTLGFELAAAGVAVVSGGALGVDGAAHAGALSAGPSAAPTVAVLGCGLDRRYPPQHAELQDEIARRGTLLTELPPGTPPLRAHFPRRNRLIAALAGALVVVRAGETSGALGTAREAQRLGIPLFAIPGPAGDPLSRGTHRLLRAGAALCDGSAEVLAALGRHPQPSPQLSGRRDDRPRPPPDERLLALLGPSPVSSDVLAREAKLTASEASAALTRLELAGLAARGPGDLFHRPRGS